VEHPRIGRFPLPNTPVEAVANAGRRARPLAGLGEHTDDVLRELLDLSDAEIARLREAGAIA